MSLTNVNITNTPRDNTAIMLFTESENKKKKIVHSSHMVLGTGTSYVQSVFPWLRRVIGFVCFIKSGKGSKRERFSLMEALLVFWLLIVLKMFHYLGATLRRCQEIIQGRGTAVEKNPTTAPFALLPPRWVLRSRGPWAVSPAGLLPWPVPHNWAEPQLELTAQWSHISVHQLRIWCWIFSTWQHPASDPQLVKVFINMWDPPWMQQDRQGQSVN